MLSFLRDSLGKLVEVLSVLEVSFHFEHLLVLSLVGSLLVPESLIRNFFVEVVPLK